jgi:hypothetical protein
MLSSVEVGSERTPKEMVNKKRYILFDLRIFWMDRGKACYAMLLLTIKAQAPITKRHCNFILTRMMWAS